MAVQTLRLSVFLPDDTQTGMQLRLSANDADCDVVISMPLRPRSEPFRVAEVRAGDAALEADDDVFGDCTGI